MRLGIIRIIAVLIIISIPIVIWCTRDQFRKTHKKTEVFQCENACNNGTSENFTNVHIIPHSHTEPGWLKSFEQYHYGSNDGADNVGVRYIFDEVIGALQKDPRRRFIWVETAFFWKWWMEQSHRVSQTFRDLIENGQLEMVGGGWTMNDEATTNYQSIIDQLTWGLKKINDTLGTCARPKVGWQIDSFGHSREMASIFAQLGYDGLILDRIDADERQIRKRSNTLEMVWKGSDSLGDKSDIFTSIMYKDSAPPIPVCFDKLCRYPTPIIVDEESPDFNADQILDTVIKELELMSKNYETNHLLVPIGGDFHYQGAAFNFENIDKLISYGNRLKDKGSKFHFLYSTPSCYLKSVQESYVAQGKDLYVKIDDFFPYAREDHRYWTGYFSSRPALKRFERVGNNFLQVCKQLCSLANVTYKAQRNMNYLREAMSLLQHHNAITGTSADAVAKDYVRQLSTGMDYCQASSAEALEIIIGKQPPRDDRPPFVSCRLTNISECAFTEKTDRFIATIYNPLSRFVNFTVRLPVTEEYYSVTDPDGTQMVVDVIPVQGFIAKIPGRDSAAKFDLVFRAIQLPPLGFKSYYVKQEKSRKTNTLNPTVPSLVFVDEKTNKVQSLIINRTISRLEQEFLSYNSDTSGAYVFHSETAPKQLSNNVIASTQHDGDVVTEIYQEFEENWIAQTIRSYKDENYAEFDWVIGPLPESMNLVIRYSTNVVSNSAFFTDSNGRQMMTRVDDFRPTWKWTDNPDVGSKYFPVASRISLKDVKQDKAFTVITDRAQGGSSLSSGQIELMVHRQTEHDDSVGLNDRLEDKAYGVGLVVRGSHLVMAGRLSNPPSGKSMAAMEKDVMQRQLLKSWTFLSSTMDNYDDYKNKFAMTFSGLAEALPENVQILTLEPWKFEDYLLRLEHVFEDGEDPTLSQPATVDLASLFAAFKIVAFRETTLGANQWLNENTRLKFPTKEHLSSAVKNNELKQDIYNQFRGKDRVKGDNQKDNGTKIVLQPLQIRTFVINIERGT